MARYQTFVCAHCGKESKKLIAEINRAEKRRLNLYCDQRCSGLGRRSKKTLEQKKAEKAEYDRCYREKNREVLKTKKAEYFQRTYDPEKARIKRQESMPKHIEYCRKPKYKAYKKVYDRQYRAKKSYGEFWECFVLTLQIQEESQKHMSKYEIDLINQRLNKAQKRKRIYG